MYWGSFGELAVIFQLLASVTWLSWLSVAGIIPGDGREIREWSLSASLSAINTAVVLSLLQPGRIFFTQSRVKQQLTHYEAYSNRKLVWWPNEQIDFLLLLLLSCRDNMSTDSNILNNRSRSFQKEKRLPQMFVMWSLSICCSVLLFAVKSSLGFKGLLEYEACNKE